MYRNLYQRGMLTIFFSGGAKPLEIWDTKVQDGYVSRFLDQDIKSMVLEIGGTNVSTTYMACPKNYPKIVLGITMPFLVMIVKNLKKYFSFEVTILDDTGTRRRFRVSNFQSTTQILPLCTAMPIGLSDGWNQIQFNLAEFTRRAYKKQFVEVHQLKINANIRLRRVYFAERLIPEDELPPEYKLYFPLSSKGKGKKTDEKDKENIQKQEADSAAIKRTSIISQSKVEMTEQKQVEGEKTVENETEDAVKIAESVTAGEVKAPEGEAEAIESEAKPSEGEVPAEGEALPPEAEVSPETPAPTGGEVAAEGTVADSEAPPPAVEDEAPTPQVEEQSVPVDAPADAPAEAPAEATAEEN